MRAEPPAELIELLERLQVAQAADLDAVQARVRQLANDLPPFPSLWVDALAHARKITPFQAAEINAGRGETLAVGPFLLTAPILSLGYADCYRARAVESSRDVNLLVGVRRARATVSQPGPMNSLEHLANCLTSIDDRRFVPQLAAGAAGDRIWIAYPSITGKSLSDVLRRTGRLSGAAVLEIARQMAAGLAALENAGVAHGDLSTRTVWIDQRGLARLAWPGVRAIIRPDEDASLAELPPEAYDYLAPERIHGPEVPNFAGDMFACGCVWWHLAAGRPPIGGGTSRGKLRAVGNARLIELNRFAADAPDSLVSAIAICTNKDPGRRPKSFHDLAEMLGHATSQGRKAVSDVYCQADRSMRGLRRAFGAATGSRDAAAWATTIAVCATVILAVTWPLLRTHDFTAKAKTAAHTNVALPEQHRASPIERSARASSGTPGVVAASYRETEASTPFDRAAGEINQSPSRRTPAVPEPLVLTADQPTVWNEVMRYLRPGQTVRGQPGERPVIAVPPTGLGIAVDDLRFENVDFIWQPTTDAPIDPERAALIDLRASRAIFSGCIFQAANRGSSPQPAAIRWSDPRRTGRLPPAGRLQLNDCVVSATLAGIVCRLNSPLEIKLSNVLFLGPGPLLELDHPPRVDEPFDIALANCTLRGADAVIKFRMNHALSEEIGAVTITANDCVLAPSSAGALVRFTGPTLPKELSRSIQWSGQGSLATPDVRVANWTSATGGPNKDDLDVAVDGLVSGQLEFAGPPDAGSSASRVTHWLAAGSSADPPGIRDGLPNLPSLDLISQ